MYFYIHKNVTLHIILETWTSQQIHLSGRTERSQKNVLEKTVK